MLMGLAQLVGDESSGKSATSFPEEWEELFLNTTRGQEHTTKSDFDEPVFVQLLSRWDCHQLSFAQTPQ